MNDVLDIQMNNIDELRNDCALTVARRSAICRRDAKPPRTTRTAAPEDDLGATLRRGDGATRARSDASSEALAAKERRESRSGAGVGQNVVG